ncbi:hypothetical protein [Methylomonas sp. AM2-LC]|uniref:hypothetical protein n=1 Tax=Methylomonas sp. AM2-LC TaxID=3153301 RepID=UPI003264A726
MLLNRIKSVCRKTFFSAFLLLSGCVSIPTGTTLNKPDPLQQSIQRNLWIGSVKITDENVVNKLAVQDSLRGNIKNYFSQVAYFSSVNTLPGNLNGNDVQFNFQFSKYNQTRSVHPAYFPLAIGTLTFYIWFGGPIYVDSSDISGVLSCQDAVGNQLFQVSSNIHDEHNVNIWSTEYSLPSGINARTSLMQDLLTQAIGKFNDKKINNTQ